ncbi:hypothetical protein D920_00479 [Enterococcus faecalis 13-SD-W-01]|nr:hypothetical protein D920_00479 [Enterococcus faecalis 13-SD-W-01]
MVSFCQINEVRDPCIEKISQFVEAAFRLYLFYQGSSVQIFRIGLGDQCTGLFVSRLVG